MSSGSGRSLKTNTKQTVSNIEEPWFFWAKGNLERDPWTLLKIWHHWAPFDESQHLLVFFFFRMFLNFLCFVK